MMLSYKQNPMDYPIWVEWRWQNILKHLFFLELEQIIKWFEIFGQLIPSLALSKTSKVQDLNFDQENNRILTQEPCKNPFLEISNHLHFGK